MATKAKGYKAQEITIPQENPFINFIQEAENIKKKAEAIIITSLDQIEEMALARELRLRVKGVRCEVEKQRKAKKENIILAGKAIDGFANIVKALTVPVEKYLQEQEDFPMIQEEKRKARLAEDREKELLKYDVDIEFYNLKDMSEERYKTLLTQSIGSHQLKIAAQKKFENERIAREKAYEEEQEKIRLENIQLKKEAQQREAREKKEKAKREAREKKLEAGREKERQAEAARLKIAEEKRIAAEAVLKKKEEQEKKRLHKEKTAKEAKEKKERMSALAPDREKLEKLATELINFKMPDLKDAKAKLIITSTVNALAETAGKIKQAIVNL